MSQDSGWLKRLLGSGARAELTLDDAVVMLREKNEALAMHEQLLRDRHAEIERLTHEEQQALSKLAALSEERSEMERRLEEGLVAARIAETQLLAERVAQRTAAARAEQLARSLDDAEQKLQHRLERIAVLEKQQAQQAAGLHYERLRWRNLVSVFWCALEQGLGAAAGLSLMRALAVDEDFSEASEVPRADTLAEAGKLLAQVLRSRALGGGVCVREIEASLQIRIEPAEPPLPDDPVPPWVGVVATSVLGRLLGQRLALVGSERAGAGLCVRARARDAVASRASRPPKVPGA